MGQVTVQSTQADQSATGSDFPILPFDEGSWAAQAYAGRLGWKGTRISWSSHKALHADACIHPVEKGAGPGVMYGTTSNNRRRNVDFDDGLGHVTGLAIDLDEGIYDLEQIRRCTARLRKRDIRYHLQWRKAASGVYKIHLMLPYAEPYPVISVSSVREAQISLTRAVLGDVKFDPSTTKAAGVLFCMTIRDGDEPPSEEVYEGHYAIDMLGHHPTWLQGEKRKGRTRETPEDATPTSNLFLSAVVSHGWVDAKGAWDIECPVGHGDDYQGKTYLYPSGTISCMAGKCQAKPLGWFIDHLPPETRETMQGLITEPLVDALEAASMPTVSVAEAHAQMQTALRDNRPVEGHATVVQVSTGAGKTRAVAEYLNEYSAPFEDERIGLTSVLALPTNALLREVEQRITIEHKTRVGVLAVLNDDGTPACKKHKTASDLQKAGGNVHRLLCNHCEYKEGCPARDGTTSGQGALTLTNQALFSSVAAEHLDSGKHPLLVWDESPPWVRSTQILSRDLDWLLAEFDEAARPLRTVEQWLQGMAQVTLFADRYRAAVRPVLECLRWARASLPAGTYSAKDIVSRWAQIPLHQMILARAIAASGQEPTNDPWADLVDAYTHAYKLNAVEMGFDVMRPETRARVVRSEKLMSALGVLAGEEAILVISKDFMSFASLTPDGTLFRQRGGVVLDATANLSEIQALRPDTRVVQLRVADNGETERYVIYAAGLERKSLAHRPKRLDRCVVHAKAAVKRWANRELIAAPKVAVFTYKAYVNQVKEQWPEAEVAYYGNTRGYDRFYQEGFDAFITLGDPVQNLGALAMSWRVLKGDAAQSDGWQEYVDATASGELAQAHGRARSPQAKLGKGGRLHMHYGKKPPAGWDLEQTSVDGLSFVEP